MSSTNLIVTNTDRAVPGAIPLGISDFCLDFEENFTYDTRSLNYNFVLTILNCFILCLTEIFLRKLLISFDHFQICQKFSVFEG